MKGWNTKKLDEICNVVRGGSPRPMGDPKYFDGDIPFIKIGDITSIKSDTVFDSVTYVNEAGAKKSRHLKKGALILSNSGTVCVPKFLGVDACIHDGFVSFQELSPYVDKRYLFHFFNYLRPYVIQKHKQGVTQVNLNTKIVGEFEVPLPPLPTQHAIVEKIEELFSDLDNGVENLKKAWQQLETYRQAVLKSAFEGKLTKQWREQQDDLPSPEELKQQIEKERKRQREKELEAWRQEVKEWKEQGEKGRKPSKPRKNKVPPPFINKEIKRLPEITENWSWVKFDEINFVKTNLVGPSDYQSYPHIAPNYIEKMTGRLLEYNTIEDDGVTSPKHLFFEGQIIYSKIRPYLSKLIIAPFDGLCSADMYPIESVLDIKFIFYYMLSDTFLNQASSAGSRSVLPKINQKELGIIGFPLCSSEEQTKIVEVIESYLSVIDNVLVTISEELQKSEALRQSILKKAFEGKLVKEERTIQES